MIRLLCICLSLLLLAAHPAPVVAAFNEPDGSYALVVVEQLRLKVPSESRQAWLEAEQGSWEPWLEQQPGFLGRQLLWDPQRQEGTLLIRWASREQWKAIPEADLSAVQQRFEELARAGTKTALGNPFPLVFEGELRLP
ncbi:TIGR03792 family protein [Cyanobium sp. HWJ4-Hawea]|uniref:TIGR03792 family protein n=1 Tax=Cyanobium sp. HWJ4-Hawea TaxID=2823713 RepID=UPI0020CC91D7|nr:TIGR03792 family protein [Cyanobium sp. HWJ4-Hawea]MCP9808047.1 TIGR03792 family protein [Cyanobium sp. HWJ4-Hawea]